MTAVTTALALELNALGKTYRARTATPLVAINNLSLSVPPGQVVGIFGPPRAGKTTLLKLIAGLVVPSSGFIQINSQDATHEHAINHQVGIVLHRCQEIDEHHSVWDALLARGQQRVGETARAERLLRDLDLWEQRFESVSAFATPLRHALHIAGTLLNPLSILLLDEPTRGMDATLAQIVETWIAEQCREAGTTVLLTARDLHTARQLCDRAVLLYEGHVLADLPADNLRSMTQQGWYQICVKGQLDAAWSDWFDGLSVTAEASGVTRLAGVVPDQPALHGLLIKVRDLGLPLLSVTCREAKLAELCAHLHTQGYGATGHG